MGPEPVDESSLSKKDAAESSDYSGRKKKEEMREWKRKRVYPKRGLFRLHRCPLCRASRSISEGEEQEKTSSLYRPSCRRFQHEELRKQHKDRAQRREAKTTKNPNAFRLPAALPPYRLVLADSWRKEAHIKVQLRPYLPWYSSSNEGISFSSKNNLFDNYER